MTAYCARSATSTTSGGRTGEGGPVLGDRATWSRSPPDRPLFAVDLTDDTAPRLLGELKIPGFSEYLHPIGDGRLLGIGSGADATTGRVTGFSGVAVRRDRPGPTTKELDALVAGT